ncbi:Putative UDP-glucuronate:xylan alpha-glucuronosyltransferase 4 [Linum perenne]
MITSISILSFSLILLILSFRYNPFDALVESSHQVVPDHGHSSPHMDPRGQVLDLVSKDLDMEATSSMTDGNYKAKVRIGLVNVDTVERRLYESLDMVETVVVHFPRVSPNLEWTYFFPSWVDESGQLDEDSCPDIPMPRLEDPEYQDLDVVVAGVPCPKGGNQINNRSEGIRDVFRLQVNLVVANLVARSVNRTVYVVFVGPCGPMLEIFRCDDMLTHVGDYWVYKPDLAKLKHKVLMPVGSCQVVPHFGHKEGYGFPFKDQQKEAYVTVLHSSEGYVCGAIALAQSIRLTNSTRDLVLLHDSSITPSTLTGLRLADYTKVIFIDSDLIVLQNMDHIFTYPQLSASFNTAQNDTIFNSGVMVIEPSDCMFKDLMAKSTYVASVNGGDQGFLNEVFTWWHRLPRKVNWLKMLDGRRQPKEGVYGLHFLGSKPWMCYRDYDCNWDVTGFNIFASDVANRKWWEVYDAIPKGLQKCCGLTRKMDGKIRKRREIAKSEKLENGRWRIQVTDPRKDHLVD